MSSVAEMQCAGVRQSWAIATGECWENAEAVYHQIKKLPYFANQILCDYWLTTESKKARKGLGALMQRLMLKNRLKIGTPKNFPQKMILTALMSDGKSKKAE